jgi:hypothetical protein
MRPAAPSSRTQEPDHHREIRRLPPPRRRGVAQELRRAREARQEGRAVRDGGRHQELRRGRRVPGEDLPELQGAVLVIHTKNNGEISEAASGKNKEELELLRRQSNEIDTWKSPYKAIVSVLMLKEGWDVRNVTTIVGLRAYAAKSNILPEQTLGRGLRRMYFGSEQRETVSVMGTPAFMEFVESIQSEGVTFERVPMGKAGRAQGLAGSRSRPNPRTRHRPRSISRCRKLTRRFNREFKDLAELDPGAFRQREAAAQGLHAGRDPRNRLQDHAGGRGRSHDPARWHRPGRLPLGRGLLRPPVAERPAPGRRLRPALSQGQGVHARPPVRPARSTSKTR